MGPGERLRALDDRVLGPPRPRTAAQYRTTYLVGLVCTVVLVLLAVATRRSVLLSGVWGFVGVLLGGGTRWYGAASTPAEQRFLRPLLAAGVVALVMLGVAVATSGRWNEHPYRPFVPPSDVGPRQETMVVLCPETSRGPAYTYQAPGSETPKCRNGAVPQVVVRG